MRSWIIRAALGGIVLVSLMAAANADPSQAPSVQQFLPQALGRLPNGPNTLPQDQQGSEPPVSDENACTPCNGLRLMQMGSYDKALDIFQRLAENGEGHDKAFALNALGTMYDEGKGVPKSYRKAFDYYKQAADMGFGPAAENIGLMYMDGEGTPVNKPVAKRWLERAIALGDDRARHYLDQLNRSTR